MPTVSGTFSKAAKIDKLPVPDKRKTYYRDTGSQGLYLSVSCRQRYAWELQIRGHGMKTIGYYHPDRSGMSLADARQEADEARRRAKAGLDPFPETTRFPAVWERYERVRVATLSDRSKEIYRSLRRRIGDRWDQRDIREITTAECQRLLEDIGARAAADRRSTSGGHSAVNNSHASLTAFFRKVWEWELVDVSPMARISRPHPTVVRERVLEPRELVAIWEAAGEEEFPYRQLVRFGMLVPLRLWSDVAAIRRDQVEAGVLRVRIKKTGILQALALPDLAIAQLDECKPIGDWYFSRSGEISNGSKGNLRRRMAERVQLEHWTFHDFRTAFHTHCCELGAPFDLVDQIQRPASRRKTAGGRHYDHSLRVEDKGRLLGFWAACVEGWRSGSDATRWDDWLKSIRS